MASSDENMRVPSEDDSQNLHKQMEVLTEKSMQFNDDLVITQDMEETEIFDQKFENSFTKEEPRKMLQLKQISKQSQIDKIKLKKNIQNNKVQIQDINIKVA